MDKNKQNKHDKAVTKSIIFSTRISGHSTSFSIKYKFIAFYCAVVGYKEKDCGKCFNEFSNMVSDIAKDWTGNNAKGLSDFVIGKVLEGLLKKPEMKSYKKILQKLQGEKK